MACTAVLGRATKWRRQTVMLYQQSRILATRDESAPIPRHAACYGIPHTSQCDLSSEN